MSSASIGPVKAMVMSLDLPKLEDKLLPALDAGHLDTLTIRELLSDFTAEHGVSLD